MPFYLQEKARQAESDRITSELFDDNDKYFELSPTPSPLSHPPPPTTPSRNDLSSSSATSPAYPPVLADMNLSSASITPPAYRSTSSAGKNLPSSSVTPPVYPPTYPSPLPDGTGVYPPYVYPTTNESSSIVQQHSGAASNFVAPSFLPPSMLGAASPTVSPLSPPGMQQVTTRSE